MIAPLKWIQSYADFKTTPKEFAHRMTMSGSKVEGFRAENENIKNVVTGKVMSLARHPDSDHLWVCSVFIGSSIIQVVTGAQNLKEGDIVPVALDGALLPDGQTIRAGRLRGVESEGMLCSLSELALTINDYPDCVEDGIMTLPADTKMGIDMIKVLGLDDVIYEFEITPNRPDCLCITGLAREAAATYGVAFSLPRPTVKEASGDINSLLSVRNNTPGNCLRYTAAIVKNVRVKPSPLWLRARLRRCGVRPINNIVDITNYVMLEYNQPMHAFDYRKIEDRQIVVRQAAKNESLVTLDGISRALTPNMMVIADGKKPLAIAGIMGGEDSGITADTKMIILESACFKAENVRASSKTLGLRTEASARFEKGLDPYNTEPALMRALELIEQLDAGDIIQGLVDAKGTMTAPKPIVFDPAAANRFLGTEISPDFMSEVFLRIGCTVSAGFVVTPPSFRADLEGPADLAEEVARFYGYNHIPATVMSGIAAARLTERQRFEQRLIDICLAAGFYEINTPTFMGQKDLDRLALPQEHPLRRAVTISNPLGEDTAFMRTTALPAMLDVIARNYNARAGRVRLFELATEFEPTADNELPIERKKLILAGYGQCDFFNIKGAMELIAKRARIGERQFEPLTDNPIFHSGRAAMMICQDKPVAAFGEVMPTVADAYGARERIYLAELDVEALFLLQQDSIVKYHRLPRFPAVMRDLALVCDFDLPSAAVARAVREGCGPILEDLRVFDVYTGDKVEPGKKSMAFNLILRDSNKTLTDQEADAAIKHTLEFLKTIGISLRS